MLVPGGTPRPWPGLNLPPDLAGSWERGWTPPLHRWQPRGTAPGPFLTTQLAALGVAGQLGRGDCPAQGTVQRWHWEAKRRGRDAGSGAERGSAGQPRGCCRHWDSLITAQELRTPRGVLFCRVLRDFLQKKKK